jgi:hypothetical protein
VIVTVDALRADALQANGGRGRMPVADEMARAGVNFRNAYCSTPHTSYSLSSLMLGAHARAVLALHGSEGRRTLAQHLEGVGYRTAAFYPPAVFAVDRARFGALATGHFGFTHADERDADAADRVRAAVTWLRAQRRDRRVLLWVHLFEPHEGYEVHPGLDFGRDPRSRYESECAQVDRALDLAVEAALDWAPPSGHGADPQPVRTLQCAVTCVAEAGRAWACVTFVHGPEGEETGPLPAGHVLEMQGTRLSRTLESLGFLVARRLLERQGGGLTSMVTASGHGVLRVTIPLPACPTPASPPPA